MRKRNKIQRSLLKQLHLAFSMKDIKCKIGFIGFIFVLPLIYCMVQDHRRLFRKVVDLHLGYNWFLHNVLFASFETSFSHLSKCFICASLVCKKYWWVSDIFINDYKNNLHANKYAERKHFHDLVKFKLKRVYFTLMLTFATCPSSLHETVKTKSTWMAILTKLISITNFFLKIRSRYL